MTGEKIPGDSHPFGRGVLRERVNSISVFAKPRHLRRSQRPVVLIDEYDKLILDSIDNSLVAIEICEG
ncbi:MAG: hypothetical protein IPN53_11130 [Comamonadaceae bacterium]|nr:hypothetical protein [Comamonadaceae bacterium]